MKAYAYFQQRGGNVIGVAEVDIDDNMFSDIDSILEHVYESLQNIQGSWSFGPNFEGTSWEGEVNRDYRDNVVFLGEHPVNKRTGQKMGERSMMIGDLITFDGKTYEVDFVGFKEYVEEAA
jgi:hypothetical protein